MANKKYQAVAKKSDSELQKDLTEAQQRLQKLEFNHVIAPLENPNAMKNLRRDIARIKTALRAAQ